MYIGISSSSLCLHVHRYFDAPHAAPPSHSISIIHGFISLHIMRDIHIFGHTYTCIFCDTFLVLIHFNRVVGLVLRIHWILYSMLHIGSYYMLHICSYNMLHIGSYCMLHIGSYSLLQIVFHAADCIPCYMCMSYSMLGVGLCAHASYSCQSGGAA